MILARDSGWQAYFVALGAILKVESAERTV
jgi:hypothetical protein